MERTRDLTFRQLADEAARYARFYFAHPERARMLADAGQPADGDYAVLVRNQFVPLESVPASTAVLRRLVRGTRLDEAERATLDEYWGRLGAAQAEVARTLKSDGPGEEATALARGLDTWPAVGLASSEAELRELMVEQFGRMRRARIAWRGVDSSTYDYPMRGGVYVLVVWFWHGR